jgi:hypothetical protein
VPVTGLLRWDARPARARRMTDERIDRDERTCWRRNKTAGKNASLVIGSLFDPSREQATQRFRKYCIVVFTTPLNHFKISRISDSLLR